MNIKSDSTKVTFTQVYQDVKHTLSALGDALKVGAEHVYEIMVRQQIVEAWLWIIVGIVSSAIMYVGLKMTLSVKFETKGYSSEPKPEHIVKLVLGVIFIVVAGIAAIGFLCNLDTITTGLINPEYGAMKEIMEFVK